MKKFFTVAVTVFTAWICMALPALAAVVAHVDRAALAEGETLTLVIESGSDQQPDLTPLEQDFELLGTSNNKQIQIINGRVNSRSSWTIHLSPKHDGNLVIPALNVDGDFTAPISIAVSKAGSGAGVAGDDDLFLEVQVEPAEAYVREQVVLTVKFYQSIDIREGSLSKVEMDNAVVEKLGDDVISEEMRNGVRYRITQRKFALFPQVSGKLTVPAVVFDGQVVVSNRNRRSFGGFDPFDRFLQQAKAVRLRSDSKEINVLPQPDSVSADWWLPVQQFSLSESWSPESPRFKVGEPVTRTLRMQAMGTLTSQLPDIKPVEHENIKVYPDQPVTALAANADTLLASKEFKMAIIPTSAGTFTLPEVRVPWWNTRTRRLETAVLPAREITVTGGAEQSASAPGTAAPLARDAGSSPVIPSAAPVAGTGAADSAGRPWLAVTVSVIWLLTVLAWWWDRRRYRRHTPAVAKPLKQDLRIGRVSRELEAACDAGTPRQIKACLVRLAQLVTDDSAVKNLEQVKALFSDAEVVAALTGLEQCLYGNAREQWDAAAFKQTLLPALRTFSRQAAQKRQSTTADKLPELYAAG